MRARPAESCADARDSLVTLSCPVLLLCTCVSFEGHLRVVFAVLSSPVAPQACSIVSLVLDDDGLIKNYVVGYIYSEYWSPDTDLSTKSLKKRNLI